MLECWREYLLWHKGHLCDVQDNKDNFFLWARVWTYLLEAFQKIRVFLNWVSQLWHTLTVFAAFTTATSMSPTWDLGSKRNINLMLHHLPWIISSSSLSQESHVFYQEKGKISDISQVLTDWELKSEFHIFLNVKQVQLAVIFYVVFW